MGYNKATIKSKPNLSYRTTNKVTKKANELVDKIIPIICLNVSIFLS